jgi:ABC-type proline/glycine betaine transport system substrate-binding protein
MILELDWGANYFSIIILDEILKDELVGLSTKSNMFDTIIIYSSIKL